MRTPDAVRCAVAAGRRRSSAVDGDRLLVRADDPAALNAYLVGQGVRVAEIGPHRRDLEQVVLEAAGRSAERRTCGGT